MSEKEQIRGGFALALAVATGRTIAECAALGNVSQSTVRRRLKSPRFMERVCQLRREMTFSAAGKVTAALDSAVETMKELLRSQNDSVRLGASSRLTDLALKMGEMSELRNKVNQLEQMLLELKSGTDESGRQVDRRGAANGGLEEASESDEQV